MPIVYREKSEGSTLLLWRITESRKALCALVTQDDIESASRLGNDGRRTERLAWRAALRSVVSDAAIAYDRCGAPFLENSDLYIGISHSGNLAAVVVSDRKCAVDIEPADRDFRKASARYISPAECALTGSDDPRFHAAVWCAKETLYKYSGRNGLDFLRDIRVDAIDFDNGIVSGSVAADETVNMRIMQWEGFIIVRTA